MINFKINGKKLLLKHPERLLKDSLSNYKNIREICIEISRIPVLLRTNSPSLIKDIKKQYGPFVTKRTKSDYIYDIIEKKNFHIIENANKKEEFILDIIKQKDIFYILSYYFIGAIDSKDKTGNLILSSTNRLNSLENFLRIIYSALCLDNNSILLHGAAILRKDRGYIFFGKSKSGKTTICLKSKDVGKVLNDNMVVIREADKKYKVFSTPFWSRPRDKLNFNFYKRFNNLNLSANIASMFKLVKGNRLSLEKMSPLDAMHDLMCCIPLFNYDPKERFKKQLSIINKITRNIPCFYLKSKKESNIWKMINKINLKI